MSQLEKSTKRVKRIEKALSTDKEKKATKATTKKSAKASKVSQEDASELQDQKVTQVSARTTELKIEKKTQHEHILARPDMYLGSTEFINTTVYTIVTHVDKEEEKEQVEDAEEEDDEPSVPSTPKSFEGIGKKTIDYNEGLMRIYIEVVSNAIDNVWQSLTDGITSKYIKINVTKDSVRVWNDGRNISTKSHEKENIPVPELIFGNLLTSSNYNDNEERKTSGRNGVGVKCSNIFSKQFSVDIFNKKEKTIYKQEWKNNMFDKGEPQYCHKGFPTKIEDGKNGYTCVEFYPDFARFHCNQFSEDFIGIMKKYAYDCANIVCINKVQVYFNNELVPIHKAVDYVNLYFPSPPKNVVSFETEDSYVVAAPAKEWTHIAFTNGVFNKNGGVHVDAWSEAIFRPLVEKLSDKTKSIDIRDIRKHFFLYVNCSLDKPAFDDQPKHKLVRPVPKVEVSQSALNKILKWDFVKAIEEDMKLKEMLTFKKETSKKKGKVEGLEDANFAGKGKKDCVLFITEGLSAKTYVVAGMKYGVGANFKGRDTIGVYPIRGKFVNVKNATATVLSKNKELLGITRALGVVYGLDYTDDKNFEKLRYKKLVLATDADVDGTHITGLLLNLFHTLYPTLLQREGFFCFMRVPIIKIGTVKTKVPQNFYFQEQAREYIEKNKVSSSSIRYFKGLGTSRDSDIKQDFGKRIVHFIHDEKADQMVENVFGEEESAFRKTWIQNHKPRTVFPNVEDNKVEELQITDFLNLELINYSIDHCKRSIPSVVDGLKESTRKVLWGASKKGLKYSGDSLKVAQFSNYVAEKTNYHHGEMNLYDTITKMAQRFAGSNNIPLFYNDGQFGSRGDYGKDAADGRYIFTKLDMCTQYIFRAEDEDFLTLRVDDGDIVEPINFCPIVPLILINGISGGIGTGWSSTIPPHNIHDIVAWIKKWLNEEDKGTLIPFYRGFKGTVEVENNRVITKGILKEEKKRFVVSEIPIGKRMTSISKYKARLDELEEKGKIKSIDNQSTENDPHFSFLIDKDFTPTLENMGLIDTTLMSNMVLFDAEGRLKKYASTSDILEEWCETRFNQYNVRKAGQLAKIEAESKVLYNKVRFIEMILEDKIVLKGKDEEQLTKELESLKFDRLPDYDYLLGIQVRQMTAKIVGDLKNKYAASVKLHKDLKAMPIKDIWINEMNELLTVYDKWVKEQTKPL